MESPARDSGGEAGGVAAWFMEDAWWRLPLDSGERAVPGGELRAARRMEVLVRWFSMGVAVSRSSPGRTAKPGTMPRPSIPGASFVSISVVIGGRWSEQFYLALCSA